MGFLPEDLIMVDCEMCGVKPERDALLQVAMLKLRLKDGQYLVSPNYLNAFLHYPGQPETEFHREFLTHIFEACNKSTLTPSQLQEQIHNWLGPLKGKAIPVGDCVSTDLDFLIRNNCIVRSDIDKEGTPIPGTFHYESFDLNPVKCIVREKLGKKIKPEKEIEGKHDALVDVFNQTLELNLFLKHLL
jgi:oligoribonuclease (3'-5' exoribonuclease)